MKKLLMLSVITASMLTTAACSDDNGIGTNQRFVEQEKIENTFVPLQDVDEAVHAGARSTVSALGRQIKLKMVTNYGGDFDKLASDLNNTNGAQLLSKLGLSSTALDGNYYNNTDYHFTFSGGKMHVTAMKGQADTRGHFKESFRIK
ncbi:MAG: hypothetical protein L3J82_02560 [Planctomycetes bacterium]|nr:hypothetical protein [Planctomycetota bacterium]